MPSERWSIVEGHPDYRVSTEGRFQSKKRGPWKDMKMSPDGSGYMQAFMCENGKMYVRKVHKLMQDAFFKKDPTQPEINHINGNKRDNRLCNLEQCSRLENMRHACDTKLFIRPDNAGKPKKRIRVVELDTVFDSMSDCARAIGANVSNVSACVAGRRPHCLGYHFELA